MIPGRDLLTALVLDLKFSENVIRGGEGPYEGCSEPMFDVNNYNFNIVTAKTVKQEEPFINAYVSERFKYQSEISATRIMRRILDAKYEKTDLSKVMTEQYQHLNIEECD